MNNIPYTYSSLNPNDRDNFIWYTLADFFSAMGMGTLDNKGFIEDKSLIIEDGVYVTYSSSIMYGIKNKPISQYDNYTNK